MAGIFGGYLSGLDAARRHRQQDVDAAYAAEERAYRQQRRGVVDEREDLSFGQGQEDRATRLARETEDRQRLVDVERPRADRMADMTERVAARKEARMPVEEAREDQKFLWQQSREGRDARADALRMQLAEYGLDEKRVEADARRAAAAFRPVLADYARTGDPRVVAEWANQTVAKDDPITIDQNEDGTWFFKSESGQPQTLGTADDVIRVARMMTNPDVYLEMQASQAKARAEMAQAEASNPERFSEMVNDDTGALHIVDMRTGDSRPVTRDGRQGPLVGTRSGKFGSRAGELTVGVRKPGVAAAARGEPDVQFIEPPRGRMAAAAGAPVQRAPSAPTARRPVTNAPPEGTRVRGPDGRIYVVRNGQPVPE
jgi:hypothetical protein